MVCVPEPLLYGLLVAAVARDLAQNGGVRSIVGHGSEDDEK